MPPVLAKRSIQILLLVLFVLITLFSYQIYARRAQERDTRKVEIGFGAALHQLEQSPSGLARVATFMASLRTIDAGHAPDEVKDALRDYIAALEQSANAARAGNDIRPYDKAISDARRRLSISVRQED